MIHKDNIEFNFEKLNNWFEEKMLIDPQGRINNHTGKRKSNGAQHTLYETPEFGFLFDKINEIAKTYFEKYIISDVWTNVNLPNGINAIHSHIGADIAGCFYVKVPENSGDIEFETGEKITPVEGDIYWWNANLKHWVHKNESDQVRYSIAFNIKNMPY